MKMMNENQTDVESKLLTIEAMLRQEQSGYTVLDYLRHLPTQTAFGQPIDADARYAIAEWCVKIMDVCHYKRETAAIAMSCLDRFVSTPDGHQILLDRKQFQLAALTAVYLVVKVHEQQAMAPHFVAKLSHGSHTKEDIEATELRMLTALQWRINPPTAMDFVRKFLELVPHESILDDKSRKVILELAQYQIDASVLEYDFCTKSASRLAFASLLNAVESVYDDGMLCSYVESLISQAANINTHSFRDLRDQLYEAISSQTDSKQLPVPRLRKPSCVSACSAASGSSFFFRSPRSVQFS
jgi:hypothetical protein